MRSITRERHQVNGEGLLAEAIAAGEAALAQRVVRRLNELLVMAVTYLLGRDFYERRTRVAPWEEMAGECANCKSHNVVRFSRNGYRRRTTE